jgi:hypothetical protein
MDCATDAGQLGACCGSLCADVLRDPHNCGVCGHACPSSSFCNNGFCPQPSCADAGDDTQCVVAGTDGGVGACCHGACVDTNTDPGSCGGCGLACPDAGSCQSGSCYYGDAGLLDCSAEPGACPTGTACLSEACVPFDCSAAWEGAPCAFGPEAPLRPSSGICCSGRCVDPFTDPENCGVCGAGSPDGECLNGEPLPAPEGTVCRPCPTPLTCLAAGSNVAQGPYCYDPSPSDPHRCNYPGSEVCLLEGGGSGACCASSGGRKCVDLETDPKNCGGCDVACPPGDSCVGGSCSGTAASCRGKIEGYCDVDAGLAFVCCPGGGCTDTRTDPHNCGACGVVCDGGCAGGACK